jgi:hypothetical protein
VKVIEPFLGIDESDVGHRRFLLEGLQLLKDEMGEDEFRRAFYEVVYISLLHWYIDSPIEVRDEAVAFALAQYRKAVGDEAFGANWVAMQGNQFIVDLDNVSEA